MPPLTRALWLATDPAPVEDAPLALIATERGDVLITEDGFELETEG